MFRLIFSMCLITMTLAGHGQYPGYSLLEHPDIFKKGFSQSTAAVQSIVADFRQEKNLAMLAEKIVSAGKFWYQRKDRLRMEYVQPYAYLVILNNGKILIKEGQHVNKMSAGSNKVFKQVNRILIDCVAGTMLDNPDFQSRIFENTGTYLAELKPVAPNLSALYKNIQLVLDRKDFSVLSIEMVEISGDRTIIRFLNKKTNVQIADSVFNIP